jgi:hypothetical protein
MKANKGWEEGCKGIIKKVSLRSRTEKKKGWGGICETRVYGLGTLEWIGLMLVLIFLRSWTSLKEPLVFLTGRMGVL